MRLTIHFDLRVALLLVLAPLPLQAAEYYVAPSGADTDPGTLAKPFASLAKATSLAQAGDTVFLRGGTYAYKSGTRACRSGTDTIYAIEISKSGAADRLIKYWAYPGEIPVFDFSGIKDSCRVVGFYVSGDWNHLKGIEFKGVPQNNNLNHESWGVLVENGSNNIFEAMNGHHNMGPGFFIRQKSSNNLVLNCDSHDNNDEHTSNGAGESADGFGCHVAAGYPGNTFRGCRAWWNTDDGFDLINAESPVLIENSWAWYSGYLPGTMTSAKNGNGFKAGGYGADPAEFPSTFAKHTVRHCLAVSNKGSGFYTNHHPVSGFFYNNTAVDNGANYNLLGMDTSGNDIHVGVLRNNVAFLGTAVSNNGTGVDDANNSWTLGLKLSAADFRGTKLASLSAPRQPDGSLPVIADYHLAADSALINKGKDVGLPFLGSAPDLGAFEFGASEESGTDAGLGSRPDGSNGSPDSGARDASSDRAANQDSAGGELEAGASGAGGQGGQGGASGQGGATETGGAGAPSIDDAGGTASAGTSRSGSGNPSPPPDAGVPSADASAGCSCRTAPGQPQRGWQGYLLVFAMVAGLRRKRRAANRASCASTIDRHTHGGQH